MDKEGNHNNEISTGRQSSQQMAVSKNLHKNDNFLRINSIPREYRRQTKRILRSIRHSKPKKGKSLHCIRIASNIGFTIYAQSNQIGPEVSSNTIKDFWLANLKDGDCLEKSLRCALWVMRLTTHTTSSPFKMHHGKKPPMALVNTPKTKPPFCLQNACFQTSRKP